MRPFFLSSDVVGRLESTAACFVAGMSPLFRIIFDFNHIGRTAVAMFPKRTAVYCAFYVLSHVKSLLSSLWYLFSLGWRERF